MKPAGSEAMKNKAKSVTRNAFHSTVESLQQELGFNQITSAKNAINLNPGTDNEIQVWGYKENGWKKLLTGLMVLQTVGFLALVLYWVDKWRLYLTCERCSFTEATKVLIMDYYKGVRTTYHVKDIKLIKLGSDIHVLHDSKTPTSEKQSVLRFFNFKKWKYIWDNDSHSFHQLLGLDSQSSLAKLHEYCNGITEETANMRRIMFGENEIVVPVHSIPILLVKEILTPFYVFQVFSVCLWYADNYWLYATAILVTSILSLSLALYNTRKNQLNLRDTIVSSETITVIRPDGSKNNIMSTNLVPGDLIQIPEHGCQMHCDAVLLEGQAIMNESMLTGESVPVTKTACAKHDVLYESKTHEKNTLKCGTQVIQTRKAKGQTVKAVVVRTGYLTTKGDLVRSILYPPPVDIQFEKDSYKFILFLAAMATVGMIYTLIKMIIDEETWVDIVLSVFDLVTIVVPPALPAAMTIGIVIAQNRLGKLNIFCISPRSINVSGSIDCVCFDKTGTITEDGMDMWGVIPSKKGLNSTLTQNSFNSQESVLLNAVRQISELNMESEIRVGMAVCHELNIIDGEVMGDPLEEKIFEFTEWKLELEGDEHSQMDKFVMPYVRSPKLENSYIQAAPQRVMEFSSDSQCMSVICRVFREEEQGEFSEPECVIFCKGSPEKMKKLCRPDTIPDDFTQVLDQYTSQGFRILALASRHIPTNMAKNVKLSKLERSEVEADLTFLGLIIMENRIKAVSKEVITELHGANIRPIMVTGDNILTAVSVSRHCGLVKPGIKLIRVTAAKQNQNPSVEFTELDDSGPPDKKEDETINFENDYYFVLDGTAFDIIMNYYKDDLLPYIAARGAVFARMRPNMKQKLVEVLQDLDYYVGMCGDGANDCGALKAAHTGISLSEAEASVASPFTSKTADISCVPQVVREGRSALVTSFGIFKYMAGYSITQFVSVMILYEFYSNLTDTQFLYIDMFIITTLAAFFGLNRAYKGPLARCPPEKSLISKLPLISLVTQLIIGIAFQFATLKLVEGQSWFVPFDYENPCYLNTTLEDAFNKTNIASIDEEYCDPEADIDPVASYENYAVFSVSQFQYIILAVAFAKGFPYRQSMFYNFPFLIDILVITGFCTYLVLKPAQIFIDTIIIGFQLLLPPEEEFSFRLLLLGLVLANAVISLLCESLLCDNFIKKNISSKKCKHDELERELANRKDWPMLSDAHGPQKYAKNGCAVKDNHVIITTQGVTDANDALNSLFSTPGSVMMSHETAAVYLNPPPVSPKRLAAGINMNESSSDSTPLHKHNKFDSALSSPRHNNTETDNSSDCNSKFVSCNSIVVDNDNMNNNFGENKKADDSSSGLR